MLNAEKILLWLPYGIALFDGEIRLAFINRAMAEITGGRGDEKPTPEQLFIDSPDIATMVQQFADTGVTFTHHEMPIFIKNEKHFAEVSVSGFAPEGGILVSIKPVDAKRELEEEMERGRKVAILSTMAAGLAHEIKNPLGGIRGAAQLMGQASEEAKEYSTIIINEVDRINGLVNNLLSPTAAGSSMKKTNIHMLLDDTIKLMQPLMQEDGRNIHLIRDYDPSLPSIKIDQNQIKQVLINLIKNAIEVMPDGELKIKTRTLLDPTPNQQHRRLGMMMAIDIIDSGSGLDEEMMEKMFIPFNTSKQSGTGLGLVISLKIVRDHGGTLTLKNRADRQQGAVARVTLPMGAE